MLLQKGNILEFCPPISFISRKRLLWSSNASVPLWMTPRFRKTSRWRTRVASFTGNRSRCPYPSALSSPIDSNGTEAQQVDCDCSRSRQEAIPAPMSIATSKQIRTMHASRSFLRCDSIRAGRWRGRGRKVARRRSGGGGRERKGLLETGRWEDFKGHS
jgi:hypothetical protein